jgi:hypothetical protein
MKSYFLCVGLTKLLHKKVIGFIKAKKITNFKLLNVLRAVIYVRDNSVSKIDKGLFVKNAKSNIKITLQIYLSHFH